MYLRFVSPALACLVLLAWLAGCSDSATPSADAAGDAAADATVDLPDLGRLDRTAPDQGDKADLTVVVGGSCITRPCTGDNECSGGFCVSGRCVSCKSNGDCTDGPRQCDQAFGYCKACSDDSHCTNGPTKCGAQGQCVCNDDTHCIRNGQPVDTGKCHNGACIGCAGDSDCRYAGSAYSRCFQGRCVACLGDDDCSSLSGTGKCTGVYSCFGCSTAADCGRIYSSVLWQCK